MKKRFIPIVAFLFVLFCGTIFSVFAQQDSIATADSLTSAASLGIADVSLTVNESWHNAIKTKFIEGNAFFMSFIALAFIIGLAFCLERIIYLNLSEIDTQRFILNIEKAVGKNNVEEALTICKSTRGPVASIYYEGLSRIDEGIDVVEKSVISAGGVQTGWLEKGLSWISLFIAMSPSLGFLGTVIGMVQAFDDIQQAGEINAHIVAGGMKVALITTVAGLIVALVLQLFYNYLLSKIESLLNKMEDATLSLLDIAVRYQVRKQKSK
ncbi:MAG: MotA/TolQ/ExbB proton channel family protein [Bacteroidales bacterium]|jgi:biopolymer transport protein ExbB|nr:MotA/TolQ/ExbB proton channel family protein [Bacteroidales bacterium]